MTFVVTGGLGLLGREIVGRILSGSGLVRRGAPVGGKRKPARVLVIDSPDAIIPESPILAHERLCLVRGDITEASTIEEIRSFALEGGPPENGEITFFHLASVMSGQGEVDFDRATSVNIDGTRSLLAACRSIGGKPRFVFASSIAAFGGAKEVDDRSKLLPETTYGMTKACAELLVNDCSRKGFVDGRIARLPTVIVRPGPPNPAATGCFSSVPKAILKGESFVSPVSPDLPHPCIGLGSAVDGMIRLHNLEDGLLGRDRAVTLPSISVTLRCLADASSTIAMEMGISPGEVTYAPDPSVEAVVAAMPMAVRQGARSAELGLEQEGDVTGIIKEYCKHFLVLEKGGSML